MRQNQMQDMLYKQFQKSPENPFNQANVLAYDANKQEERDHITARKDEIANRLIVLAAELVSSMNCSCESSLIRAVGSSG